MGKLQGTPTTCKFKLCLAKAIENESYCQDHGLLTTEQLDKLATKQEHQCTFCTEPVKVFIPIGMRRIPACKKCARIYNQRNRLTTRLRFLTERSTINAQSA